MANTIKAIDGYYTECDEYDNRIHTYYEITVDQVKQIAFNGNKIVAFMQDFCIVELEDRCLKARHYSFSMANYFQNIQLLGNTIIIETTLNESYKCEFGTYGSLWERIYN
jgi:hypothetical protein